MKKVLLIALFAATLGLMGCQKDDSSSQGSTSDNQQGSQSQPAQPSAGSSSQPSGNTSGASGS